MGLLYDYHVMLTLGFVKVISGYVEFEKSRTIGFSLAF